MEAGGVSSDTDDLSPLEAAILEAIFSSDPFMASANIKACLRICSSSSAMDLANRNAFYYGSLAIRLSFAFSTVSFPLGDLLDLFLRSSRDEERERVDSERE